MAGKNPQGKFKVSTKDIHLYTNKILIYANELNQPSTAEKIVDEEMNDYKQNKRINFDVF